MYSSLASLSSDSKFDRLMLDILNRVTLSELDAERVTAHLDELDDTTWMAVKGRARVLLLESCCEANGTSVLVAGAADNAEGLRSRPRKVLCERRTTCSMTT